jgi:hypothetical protein
VIRVDSCRFPAVGGIVPVSLVKNRLEPLENLLVTCVRCLLDALNGSGVSKRLNLVEMGGPAVETIDRVWTGCMSSNVYWTWTVYCDSY